jgi:CCR4-NOT transcription complex subunit 9
MAGVSSNELRASLASSDQAISDEDRRTLEYIAQLLNPAHRETALLELSKKREQVPELALVLWHSFGTYVKDGSGLSKIANLSLIN